MASRQGFTSRKAYFLQSGDMSKNNMEFLQLFCFKQTSEFNIDAGFLSYELTCSLGPKITVTEGNRKMFFS